MALLHSAVLCHLKGLLATTRHAFDNGEVEASEDLKCMCDVALGPDHEQGPETILTSAVKYRPLLSSSYNDAFCTAGFLQPRILQSMPIDNHCHGPCSAALSSCMLETFQQVNSQKSLSEGQMRIELWYGLKWPRG